MTFARLQALHKRNAEIDRGIQRLRDELRKNRDELIEIDRQEREAAAKPAVPAPTPKPRKPPQRVAAKKAKPAPVKRGRR